MLKLTQFTLLLLFVFISQNLYSQKYRSDIIIRDTLLFKVESEVLPTNATKISIWKDESNKSGFILKPFKLSEFEIGFVNSLNSLLPENDNKLDDTEKKNLKPALRSLFFNIISEGLKGTDTAQPLAGSLKSNDSITLYKGTSIENKDSVTIVNIKDIEIEFYEGFIETIKVNGIYNKNDEKTARFENKYGIGFSTRNSFKQLKKIALFDSKSELKSSRFILLGELFDFDYSIQERTRDFSPANQTLNTFGGQNVELYKEKSSKLFEMVVYSDFLGIDKNNSNGLLQSEISKRINLSSKRKQFWHPLDWFAAGYGFFQYIEPSVVISKIEENNKTLIPERNDFIVKEDGNHRLIQENWVNPISLLEYSNLSLGLNLNLLFIDNPGAKFQFFVNGGFRFNRTEVMEIERTLLDSVTINEKDQSDPYGVNYFTFYPELKIKFMPDKRYGLNISSKWQYFKPAFSNPSFHSEKKNWINSSEIMMYVHTSEKGRLFGRWKFNYEIGNISNNFHQLQVGYSIYILKNN